MDYAEVPASQACGLLTCGGLAWVCSRSPAGRYDLTPIAWVSPLDYEPTSRVLFVSDPAHACMENILASRDFVLALPTPEQRGLVEKTGSVSGTEVDKFEEFSIQAFKAKGVDARVPAGVGAYLECSLIRTVEEGSVSIVLGEVGRAAALPEAWKLRLHYVGDGLYYAPGPRLGPGER